MEIQQKNIIKTMGVLIIKDNKVLLVKHKESAGHLNDKYGLPAGRIELNESEKEAGKRELKEETGLDVELNDLVLLPKEWEADIERKDGTKKSFFLKVFYTDKFSNNIQDNDETLAEWVDISSLKNIDLLPNVLNIINFYFEQ